MAKTKIKYAHKGIYQGSGWAAGASSGALSTCCRFGSRETSVDSGGLFLESLFSLPLTSRVLFSAAFLASLSFLSFSRRSALDSNSCQSPSICWSLHKKVVAVSIKHGNTKIPEGSTHSTTCRGSGASVVK